MEYSLHNDDPFIKDSLHMHEWATFLEERFLATHRKLILSCKRCVRAIFG
jgi:hypothetical protein